MCTQMRLLLKNSFLFRNKAAAIALIMRCLYGDEVVSLNVYYKAYVIVITRARGMYGIIMLH